MKGADISTFSSQHPRRQKVARSAAIVLLGLAGLLWWDYYDKHNIGRNGLNSDDIPGSGFSWHQVGFTTLSQEQRD